MLTKFKLKLMIFLGKKIEYSEYLILLFLKYSNSLCLDRDSLSLAEKTKIIFIFEMLFSLLLVLNTFRKQLPVSITQTKQKNLSAQRVLLFLKAISCSCSWFPILQPITFYKSTCPLKPQLSSFGDKLGQKLSQIPALNIYHSKFVAR